MSLRYLVKLEMLITHVLRLPLLPIVTKRNSRIYLTVFYRLLSKLYFIFAIDIESYCDFLASSSAIDVDRP